jgi:hypothetical protein
VERSERLTRSREQPNDLVASHAPPETHGSHYYVFRDLDH